MRRHWAIQLTTTAPPWPRGATGASGRGAPHAALQRTPRRTRRGAGVAVPCGAGCWGAAGVLLECCWGAAGVIAGDWLHWLHWLLILVSFHRICSVSSQDAKRKVSGAQLEATHQNSSGELLSYCVFSNLGLQSFSSKFKMFALQPIDVRRFDSLGSATSLTLWICDGGTYRVTGYGSIHVNTT